MFFEIFLDNEVVSTQRNFFNPKEILIHNFHGGIFELQNLGTKNVGQKILDAKEFFSKKKFGKKRSSKNLCEKSFCSKTFLVQQNYLVQKIFGYKKKKICKKMFGLKSIWVKRSFAQ